MCACIVGVVLHLPAATLPLHELRTPTINPDNHKRPILVNQRRHDPPGDPHDSPPTPRPKRPKPAFGYAASVP